MLIGPQHLALLAFKPTAVLTLLEWIHRAYTHLVLSWKIIESKDAIVILSLPVCPSSVTLLFELRTKCAG